MAAKKEAIVIIFDVGSHMVDGQPESSFSKSKKSITRILERKIFSESKDEISVILFGTEDTSNCLNDGTGGSEYMHITELSSLKPAGFELVTDVGKIEPSPDAGSFVDALVVAFDMLHNQTKGQKFGNKRVILFTNFSGGFSDDDIDTIISVIKKEELHLTVIGPNNFCDGPGNSDNTNNKENSETRKEAEALMFHILENVDGEAYRFEEALPALENYQRKTSRPACWNAPLEIGNNLVIDISGFYKTTEAKPKTSIKAYAKNPDVAIVTETTTHKTDDDITEVAKENVVSGFKYGKSNIVPYTEEDKVNMDYQNDHKGFKVLHFTNKKNVRHHMFLGEKAMYVVGRKNSVESQVAINALVSALYETDNVAIVRYAYSARFAPRIGVLLPKIKKNFQCLVFIQLPYMEDCRRFTFPSLPSTSQNVSADQEKAIDDLIDCMDLMTGEVDSDGKRCEALKSKNFPNPYAERLCQCLNFRALHPNDPLPEMPERIKKSLEPSKELSDIAKPPLSSIKRLFPLEVVTAKKARLIGGKTFQDGGNSGDTLTKDEKVNKNAASGMAELVTDTVMKIGTVEPVSDFKKLVSEQGISLDYALNQFQMVIIGLAKDPLAAVSHVKMIDCLKAFREAALKEQAKLYNDLIAEIKKIVCGKLKNVWDKIVDEKLGLIIKSESDGSNVSDEEGKAFLSETPVSNSNLKKDDDVEDLLDMM